MNVENKTESRLVLTADGSHSVWNPAVGQYYHSVLGALQESRRVFIELGLLAAFERFETVRLLEMGFGTGLNALLTLLEAQARQRPVDYTTVEAYPLPLAEARQLNFDAVLGTNHVAALHEAPWHQPVAVHPQLTLTKYQTRLQDFRTEKPFNLVYFDAFAPRSQPELWTTDSFRQLALMMQPGGLLTTYCSKSYVQRNLKAAGFRVEKHPGPARKREVLRAVLE